MTEVGVITWRIGRAGVQPRGLQEPNELGLQALKPRSFRG